MKKLWSVITCYTQSKKSGTIAISIPQGIVKELEIAPGDRLQVSLDGANIIYEKVE
jgi:antitoxin component of MazEF toxin-antitoxin module